MKKAILMITTLCFSCASQVQENKVQSLNYSLLESIYNQVDIQSIKPVDSITLRSSTILKSPSYIKVYRGSYKDEKGNVVESGFEWLKVDDGIPSTNF